MAAQLAAKLAAKMPVAAKLAAAMPVAAKMPVAAQLAAKSGGAGEAGSGSRFGTVQFSQFSSVFSNIYVYTCETELLGFCITVQFSQFSSVSSKGTRI